MATYLVMQDLTGKTKTPHRARRSWQCSYSAHSHEHGKNPETNDLTGPPTPSRHSFYVLFAWVIALDGLMLVSSCGIAGPKPAHSHLVATRTMTSSPQLPRFSRLLARMMFMFAPFFARSPTAQTPPGWTPADHRGRGRGLQALGPPDVLVPGDVHLHRGRAKESASQAETERLLLRAADPSKRLRHEQGQATQSERERVELGLGLGLWLAVHDLETSVRWIVALR